MFDIAVIDNLTIQMLINVLGPKDTKLLSEPM